MGRRLQAIRDFLNGAPPHFPHPHGEVVVPDRVVDARETLRAELLERDAPSPRET